MDIFWNTTIEDPWHVQLRINVKSTMAHQCTFRYLNGQPFHSDNSKNKHKIPIVFNCNFFHFTEIITFPRMIFL